MCDDMHADLKEASAVSQEISAILPIRGILEFPLPPTVRT
jgi:hypothetical protein